MAQLEFITCTSRVELRALAWQGIQAPGCYEQLVRILQTKLSPRHAALLAQPIMDTDASNANSQDKEVDWYFNSPKEAHNHTSAHSLNAYETAQNPSPIKLINLPPTSQAMLRQTFMELGQDIYNLAQTLKANHNSNTVTAGNLLELAISFPSEDYLYAVGAQPVLVAWGFAPANIEDQPETLTRIRPGPFVANATMQQVAQGATYGTEALRLNPTLGQTNIQEERKVTFSSIPWAIIAFLLGALICAVLLFWLLPKWGIINFGGGPQAPIPLLNATEQATNPLINEELLLLKQQEQTLREELHRLNQELREKMLKCPQASKPGQPGPLDPLGPLGPLGESAPLIPLPEEITPPLAPPEPQNLPELEPEEVPPVPDLPLPEMNLEPELNATIPESQKPTEEPSPEQPKTPELPPEPDFLEIPNNPKELGFLEGCWNAKIGLKNRQTGQPVTVEYCFDQSGNGTVTITERDRSGKVLQKCTGSAQAKVQGNDLQITDSGAQCPDGKLFGGNSVVCRNNAQQAQCDGQSQSGEKWGPVPFKAF